MFCFQASAPHPALPFGARSAAAGSVSSPRAPGMTHFGGDRAPGRNLAAAQGFNTAPGAASGHSGQGLGTVGAPPRVALPSAAAPGDPTNASALYDNYQGLGGKPVALPASPMGYGAAYSPSDPCKFCPYYPFRYNICQHMIMRHKV